MKEAAITQAYTTVYEISNLKDYHSLIFDGSGQKAINNLSIGKS